LSVDCSNHFSAFCCKEPSVESAAPLSNEFPAKKLYNGDDVGDGRVCWRFELPYDTSNDGTLDANLRKWLLPRQLSTLDGDNRLFQLLLGQKWRYLEFQDLPQE